MDDIVTLIKHNAVGVFPTDTLYGLVGSAFSKTAVARIYKVKGRDDHKPFIVLISSLNDLKKFGVTITVSQKKVLNKLWPGPVSVILSCPQKSLEYLHRGNKSLAFRFPKDPFIQTLIKKTGPLVAPSANPQGKKPAETIIVAQAYFHEGVDFYVTKGTKKGKASAIVDITKDVPSIIRQGAKKISL